LLTIKALRYVNLDQMKKAPGNNGLTSSYPSWQHCPEHGGKLDLLKLMKELASLE